VSNSWGPEFVSELFAYNTLIALSGHRDTCSSVRFGSKTSQQRREV